MSGPVDVLADLRGLVRIAKAASIGVTGKVPRIERAERAIVAVEELIEAASAGHDRLVEYQDHQALYFTCDDAGRLRAALARMGGQP